MMEPEATFQKMKDFSSTELSNRVPWVNLAVGILTIISPWVLRSGSTFAQWDMTITGIVLGIVAIISMSVHAKHYWPVVNILAGIWLLVSITFLGNMMGMVWSNVVLGVLAIVTGLISQTY